MLPRLSRLRRGAEIQRIVRQGKTLTAPYLKVYYMPSVTSHTRVACVVGKTVHRSSVQRHRYQRWLRELARATLLQHPPHRPYDMVWVARPGVTTLPSFVALKEDFWSRWRGILG